MAGRMRAIADFLEVQVKPEDCGRRSALLLVRLDEAQCNQATPLGGAFWDGGAEIFINKGTNGRWQQVLSAADSKAYEARARAELGEECATWLAQQ